MTNYYDLDDILTEEQYVSVKFRIGANGIGILDPGSEDNNVKEGANVELPLWLAHDLCSRSIVSIKLPYFFNERFKKEVKADAACVNLGKCCPYFYALGCKLAPISPDPDLGLYLMYCLRGRYKEILCKALASPFNSTPKMLSLLTQEESRIFEAARDSMRAFHKWRFEGTRLERSAVLGKKRRLNALLCPFDLT